MITMFKSTLLGRAPHWPGSMRWYLCSTYQALFLERGWVSLECWINVNQTLKKWELTNCRKFLGICCQVVSIPSTSFPTGSLKFSLLHIPDIFIMSSIVYQNKWSFSKNLNPAWLVWQFSKMCVLWLIVKTVKHMLLNSWWMYTADPHFWHFCRICVQSKLNIPIMSPLKQCLDEPVLDSVDGDVVAEDRIDNLIQLVRVVDRCVKGELLQERILQLCSIS